MRPQRGEVTVTQIHQMSGAPSTYTFPDAYFEIDDRGVLIISNSGGALSAYVNWDRVHTTPLTNPAKA